MSDLECVVTGGGPLIALPTQVANAWRGTLPPLDVLVPEGWTWGDGGITCDYDRACDEPRESLHVNDSFRMWWLAVSYTRALILEGECSTAALPWDGSLVIARDVGGESERDVRVKIGAFLPEDWVDTRVDLDLAEGALSIFDAAWAGDERARADGGVLEVSVARGRYRVWMACAPSDRATFLHLRRV